MLGTYRVNTSSRACCLSSLESQRRETSISKGIIQLTYFHVRCSMGRTPSFSPRLEGAEVSGSDAEVCIIAPLNWGRLSLYTARDLHVTGSTRHARVHDDTGRQCMGSSPALPQHLQQHNPIPETSKSSQLLLPWQRQSEDLPAFDVLICLKHAKCHSEAGERYGGVPDCPEDGRLSKEQEQHTGKHRCHLLPQQVITSMLLFLCSGSPT